LAKFFNPKAAVPEGETRGGIRDQTQAAGKSQSIKKYVAGKYGELSVLNTDNIRRKRFGYVDGMQGQYNLNRST
jgi:hypothetical protein